MALYGAYGGELGVRAREGRREESGGRCTVVMMDASRMSSAR